MLLFCMCPAAASENRCWGFCLVCTLGVQLLSCLLACLSLSLSRCVFSLPQLRTVSSIPAHFAQSRLSVRHQPLSGLLLPHTVCGCSILTCICSFVLLQLKVSPVFRHPLHLFPLLSVKHVLSCCCNVSPLSVFQDAPLFLWYTNPSQAPLCVSAWDLSVCCLFASVFSTR